MRRRSICLPSFAHSNPIPTASIVDGVLATGALTGKDPDTGQMPPTLDAQCVNIFARVEEVMSAAGGSTDEIVKMTVHLVDYRDRTALNREWLAMFPDPESMPARQVIAAALDGGALIHADLIAVLSADEGTDR